jgi:hypothetical protein
VIKAEIGGMVALQNVFRNNSMGHAQEGDQLWPGQPLLRIFDPTVMMLDLTSARPMEPSSTRERKPASVSMPTRL